MATAVKNWVLLDEEGEVVRRFDHPAPGTVEVVVKKLTYKEMMAICGEAPFWLLEDAIVRRAWQRTGEITYLTMLDS